MVKQPVTCLQSGAKAIGSALLELGGNCRPLEDIWEQLPSMVESRHVSRNAHALVKPVCHDKVIVVDDHQLAHRASLVEVIVPLEAET